MEGHLEQTIQFFYRLERQTGLHQILILSVPFTGFEQAEFLTSCFHRRFVAAILVRQYRELAIVIEPGLRGRLFLLFSRDILQNNPFEVLHRSGAFSPASIMLPQLPLCYDISRAAVLEHRKKDDSKDELDYVLATREAVNTLSICLAIRQGRYDCYAQRFYNATLPHSCGAHPWCRGLQAVFATKMPDWPTLFSPPWHVKKPWEMDLYPYRLQVFDELSPVYFNVSKARNLSYLEPTHVHMPQPHPVSTLDLRFLDQPSEDLYSAQYSPGNLKDKYAKEKARHVESKTRFSLEPSDIHRISHRLEQPEIAAEEVSEFWPTPQPISPRLDPSTIKRSSPEIFTHLKDKVFQIKSGRGWSQYHEMQDESDSRLYANGGHSSVSSQSFTGNEKTPPIMSAFLATGRQIYGDFNTVASVGPEIAEASEIASSKPRKMNEKRAAKKKQYQKRRRREKAADSLNTEGNDDSLTFGL